MKDLQKFTENILQKEKEQLEQKKQQFLQQYQLKLDETKNHFEQVVVDRTKKIKEDICLEKNIKKMQIENSTRNAVLKEKQNQLKNLFELALDNLKHIDENQFKQLVQKVIAQLNSNKSYKITFGEYTNFNVELPNFIVNSNETIAGEYGFVIEYNGIIYNYLYKTIINDVKENYLGELSKVLSK